MKKSLSKLLVALLLVPAALAPGRVWVGIGAVAAANGASTGVGAAIGVLGVSDSVLWGIAVGTCVGGPAGTIAGAVAGL